MVAVEGSGARATTPPHKTLNLMRVQLGDRSSPGSSQGLELFIKFISVLCSYLTDAFKGGYEHSLIKDLMKNGYRGSPNGCNRSERLLVTVGIFIRSDNGPIVKGVAFDSSCSIGPLVRPLTATVS